MYQRCLLLAFSILIASCVRSEVVASAELQPPTTPTAAPSTTTHLATTITDGADRPGEVDGIPRADQSEAVLVPGRYIVLGPGFPDEQRAGGWPEVVTVSVPEGWSSVSRQRGGGLHSAGASLEMGSVANVVADPCPQDLRVGGFDPPALLDPPVGPTVDDLASALGSIPGAVTTAPVEVTRAGFRGVQMNLTIPADLYDCGEGFYLWMTTPSSGEFWYGWSLLGWIHRLWILDVDGQRFVIDASSAPEASQEGRLELLRVVSSIEIQP